MIRDAVTDEQGTDPHGQVVPAIGIQHGPAKILVVERDGFLTMVAQIDIPAPMRESLSRFGIQLQEKMLETLKLAFMDVPRVGWTILPPSSTRIDQVERVLITELLRISESDIGSFNRFCDAIQELTTLVVRAIQVYTAPSKGSTSPNSPMYR